VPPPLVLPIAGAAGLSTLIYKVGTSNFGYVHATAFTRQITIKNKFSRTETVTVPKTAHRNSSSIVATIFMVSDTKGRVYDVSNNFWRFQFKSTELWNHLDEGQNYRVKGYGWRIGMIYWYPNIVRATKCDITWKCKGNA
jgi:hypothetical protein